MIVRPVKPNRASMNNSKEDTTFAPDVSYTSAVLGGAYKTSDPLPSVGASEKSPTDNESGCNFPCPCCGFLTYPVAADSALAYICPVCYWENDLFEPNDKAPSDENHGLTLCQARRNFLRFGACDERFVSSVRQPFSEEAPNNAENTQKRPHETGKTNKK